jgi:2-aminoadipate transaminase
MDFTHLLATRTKAMRPSAIREILKVVSQPGMVSLAGGIPAPESFPLDIMGELAEKVIEKYASKAFQYDLAEGFIPLREVLVEYLTQRDIHVTAEEILIGSGSQGVLDAAGIALISRGDKVAVETPTYLGAIQAFNPYQPEYIRMETDDDGLIPESLEQALRSHTIKFIYLVPTFQNPTGRTITLERRKQIAEIIQRYEALLIEDDPYSALRYKGTPLPPIKSFAPDNVLYISTLSKVLAPGLRIGFYAGPPEISRWLVVAKQGIDLQTSTFSQALAAEYISGGYLDQQLPKIIRLYKPKLETMLAALEKYFPDNFYWSKPEGGMFIWAEGPKGMNMEELYWKAVEKQVAFVPGKYFYTQEGEGLETMRLNFTMSDEATIDRAVKVLAGVIKSELK